ncbi:hypothetical protein GCM10023322_81330 [Rugosimonospora acidiphila]|uniref:Uncharacterized protein n=1 Tax=Rugosimonospora acidiphila TaxID=556531 RepID=A0ABP9SUA7_9ACTN
MPMDRHSADQALTGLGAAHDRIAAAMFVIDSHAGLAFLRGTGLTGRTAERARAISPEVDLLWAHFNALTGLLDRARAIRGQRRLGDDDWEALRLLLAEPVLALDGTGLPVEAGSTAVATLLGVRELSNGLEQRCGTMTTQLAEVDAAWSAVAGCFAPLTEAFGAVAGQAEELGVAELTRSLGERLDQGRSANLRDPLTAAPAGQLRAAVRDLAGELASELDTVRQRVAGLAALRDRYPDRIAALATLVEEVAAAESGVRDAYARAEEKILAPDLPVPPAAAGRLRAALPGPDDVHKRQWVRLAEDLAALEESARLARGRAEQLRDAADGLLARRQELRGRLDAYRAKAARVGFAEDTDLSVRYQRAHDLLFTAPCDLRQSTRAVYAYQQALAELIASSKEPR